MENEKALILLIKQSPKSFILIKAFAYLIFFSNSDEHFAVVEEEEDSANQGNEGEMSIYTI